MKWEKKISFFFIELFSFWQTSIATKKEKSCFMRSSAYRLKDLVFKVDDDEDDDGEDDDDVI